MLCGTCVMADCDEHKTVAPSRSQATKGLQCFALNCFNYRNSTTREKGITFHKFPDKDKREYMYSVWMNNCGREIEPSQHSRVCSEHFEKSCFIRTLLRTQLREDAVPTMFQESKNMKRKKHVKQATYIPPPRPFSGSKNDVPEVKTWAIQAKSCSVMSAAPPLMPLPCSKLILHWHGLQEEARLKRIAELSKQRKRLLKEIKAVKTGHKRPKTACAPALKQHTEMDHPALGKLQFDSCKDIPCEFFPKSSPGFSEDEDFADLRSPLQSYKFLTGVEPQPVDETVLRRWIVENKDFAEQSPPSVNELMTTDETISKNTQSDLLLLVEED